jgi:DNA repair protein RecO (recombination protein O)
MSEREVCLQPGFILHQRAYRESSLLLECLTRDYGIVSLLAKGVRKPKSPLAGVLLAFTELRVSFVGQQELKILTKAEYLEDFALQRLALYCGFYVNELLQKFLYRYDPHPALFDAYHGCLQQLAKDAAIEQTLRYFELSLLEETGYGFDLNCEAMTGGDVRPEYRYRYQADVGIVKDEMGKISGKTLLCLAQRADLSIAELSEAKVLLRSVVDHHLQGRPLKSREVLGNIIRYL